MSPGKVRKIEEGLPLINATHTVASVEEARRLMEQSSDRTQKLINLMYDFNPEEQEVLTYEQQLKIEERKAKEARMKARRARRERNTTGIIKTEQNGNIIQSVGRINLRSVSQIKQKPPEVNPFPEHPHLKPFTVSRDETTVPLVRNEMKKVFRADRPPFSGIEQEDDFPIEKLYKESPVMSGMETPHTKMDDLDELDAETPSLLVDPHAGDLLWSRNKAPFTKGEVDMLYSWRNQSDALVERKERSMRRMLTKRERDIKTTFESRKAFEHRLKMVEKAIDTATFTGPGKGQRPKESAWTVSARLAMEDPTSLPYRRKKWSDFVQFVRQHGCAVTDSQQYVCLAYRSELMTGEPADKNLFWRFVDQLREIDYQLTPTMLLLEYLRIDYGLTSAEILQYMEQRIIPEYFYKEAIDQYNVTPVKKKAPKKLIIDKTNCDPESLSQMGIWERPTRIRFAMLEREEEIPKKNYKQTSFPQI